MNDLKMRNIIRRWLGLESIIKEQAGLRLRVQAVEDESTRREQAADQAFTFCAGEIEKLRDKPEPEEAPAPLVRRAAAWRDFREAAEAPLHKRRT